MLKLTSHFKKEFIAILCATKKNRNQFSCGPTKVFVVDTFYYKLSFFFASSNNNKFIIK